MPIYLDHNASTPVDQRVLDEMLPYFVKVMPMDYRLALEKIKANESRESETVEVTEEVYS